MIKATRNGIAAIFSDNDWKTGQPQRYGWQEAGKEGKTLPKEIINFIERRKAPEPVEPVVLETALGDTITITAEKVTKTRTEPKPDRPTRLAKPKPNEQVIQIDKKTKTKANDNPKQKGRASGKHKPGAVEKA